jgi:O-antigen/teichoic acid export membrane protein
MNNSTKINVANITIYNFLSRIVFYIFVFGASVYTSRNLPAEQFGQLQYINFSIVMLWTLFNFGSLATFQRFYAAAFRNYEVAHLAMLKRFLFCSSLTSTIVAFVVWYAFAYFTNSHISVFVLLLMISQFLSNYFQSAAQSTFRYKTLAIGNLIICMLGGILIWITLPMYGMDGYIYTFIITNALFIIWNLYVFMNAKPEGSPNQTMELTYKILLRNAMTLAASSILAAVLWQRTEFYFIKKYSGYTELAAYSIALSVLALSLEIFRILPGAMMGFFSAHRQDKERASDVYFRFMRYMQWLVVFVAFFVFVHAREIIIYIYSSTYADSYYYLKVLIVGYSLGALSFLTMQLHIGLGKNRFLLQQDFFAAILVIVACFLFIPIYGSESAAWIKSIVVALTAISGFVYHSGKLKITFPLKHLFTCVITAAVVVIPLSGFLQANLWWLIGKAGLLFFLYTLLSFYVGIIDKEIFQVLRKKL